MQSQIIKSLPGKYDSRKMNEWLQDWHGKWRERRRNAWVESPRESTLLMGLVRLLGSALGRDGQAVFCILLYLRPGEEAESHLVLITISSEHPILQQ